MFQLKGPKILIILFSVTTVLQLSESQCTRGTYYYKDNGSSNCTKCPKNTFMDVNNHTHTECKRCRTTKEPHEPHVEVRRECNVTHDLFLNCSQNHFVQVEDKGLNRVECFECQVCSNGKQFEILPCNGINDTFCCASVDMIAEPNKDGIYECASRPSTTSSTTTTPTTAASNTSRKDVSTSDVSNQTTDVVTSPASSGQTDLPDSSLTTGHIVSIAVVAFVVAGIVIGLLICCGCKKLCCFKHVCNGQSPEGSEEEAVELNRVPP